jgi:type I restriction enzyme, S subunit
MSTNQGFKSLVPNHAILVPDYLYHWLRANRRYIESLGNGATFKEISKKTVESILVPLPPIEEQRRIAVMLDQVNALREQRRKVIALLDELTQSIFIEMFGDPVSNSAGWQQLPLGQILENIDSGSSPVCHSRPAQDLEWGVLKLSAVSSCVFRPEENKALGSATSFDRANEVHHGDLLFSRKNTPELVAACALVESPPPRLLLPDLIFRLRVRDNASISKTYLHRLLTYPPKRREVQKLASGSASSMSNISKAKLLKLMIELPPLDLQLEFEQKVAEIERQKKAAQAHLAELDALFASIQWRAFRGELWETASDLKPSGGVTP